MYQVRKQMYAELGQARNSKVIVYVTGDRQGQETQIHPEVLDYFANHLDSLNRVDKITLYLYTRGGSTLAAWSIVNLIRQFCNNFEVIVPSKAHSSGTLICLGANTIVMTKQATLGPIDPSVNMPLNPQVPGAPPTAKVPVSVEAIKGFLGLAREEMKIKDKNNLTSILLRLSETVHPLVLGEVYRAKTQIQMLGRKLLSAQIKDNKKIEKIISFLVSDSGSHDYTIHRSEAKEQLGLNIEKPDDKLYSLIKRIYEDIATELELRNRFDPNSLIGQQQQVNYCFKRGLIETFWAGSDAFVSEGLLFRRAMPQQSALIEDQRLFEGWRHENA
jgi:hypothetical protein